MSKKPAAATVADYLAQLDDDRREPLSELREVVRKAIPNADERVAHGMPCYFVAGDKLAAALASQKQYMALYICETSVVEQFADELAHLNCGKSCIRFKSIDELPLAAVRKMVKESARRLARGKYK